MRNTWISADSVDPIAAWELSLPLASPEQRFDILEKICQYGNDSGVFTITGVAAPLLSPPLATAADYRSYVQAVKEQNPSEIFPFFDTLASDGTQVTITSEVSYIDPQGDIATTHSHNAGELLRQAEPDLDDTYRRRFAADHPFIGLWSETHNDRLSVTFAFWSDIWTNDEQRELHDSNHARLNRLQQRLNAMAAELNGTFKS